jgi:uncharacterized protein YdaU (DUF1376 family)
MPLYINDYRNDTMHLSAAQHGAYLLLIMHYWMNGGLPKDNAALARIAAMSAQQWSKNRKTVMAFFSNELSHKRIEQEIGRSVEISGKRRSAAMQMHSKSRASAEQKHTHFTLSKKDAAEAALPPFIEGPLSSPEKELFEKGKQVLGRASGGLIRNLLKAKAGNIALARAAIEQASTKQNPREYISRIVRGASEETKRIGVQV